MIFYLLYPDLPYTGLENTKTFFHELKSKYELTKITKKVKVA